LLQANLKKIGIDMELTPGQFNVLWDQAKKLETAANINVLRWWPSYPTPVDWLYGIFESTQVSSYNMSHYANPKVDSLIKTGMELEGKDRQAAIKAYQEVQKTLVEDAVAIFAGDLRDIVPKAKSIKGYVYNPGYNSPFFYELYRE
jgi:peptide/nickel transport system substrate-binding protein